MTTYYVDFLSGSDSNNGLSKTTPWKHHPWDTSATGSALSCVLVPGDEIYIALGAVSYNSYLNCNDAGTIDNPIVTLTDPDWGYSDETPFFCGGVLGSSLTWGGSEGAWTVAIGTQPNLIVRAGLRLVQGTDFSYSTGVLTINSTDMPGSDTIIGSKSNVVLQSAANHQFHGVGFEIANGASGSLVFTNGIPGGYYEHCKMRFTNAYGVYSYNSAGLSLIDCDVENFTSVAQDLVYFVGASGSNIIDGGSYRNSGGKLIYMKAGAEIVVKNAELSAASSGIINDPAYRAIMKIEDCSIHGITASFGYGVRYLNAGSGGWVKRTYVDGCLRGLSVEGTDGCLFEDNLFQNNPIFGAQLLDSDNNSVKRNQSKDNWNGRFYGQTSPAPSGYGIIISGSSEGNRVFSNTVTGNYLGISLACSSGGGNNIVALNDVRRNIVNDIDTQNTGTTAKDVITHNFVLHSPAELNTPAFTGHGISAQIAAKRVMIACNNVVVDIPDATTEADNCQGICVADTYTDIVVDYNNVFVKSAYGMAYKYKTTNLKTLAEWLSAISADAAITSIGGGTGSQNDISEDPVSINESRISNNSPCVDTGTWITGVNDTGEADIWGKYLHRLPNIGADQGAGSPGSIQIVFEVES